MKKAHTNVVGSVLTEVSDGSQDNGFKLRPLMFPEPAHELTAIGRRKFAQFPRLPLEQVGHSNLSAKIMREDIGTLLRRNLNSKDIYELLGVIKCHLSVLLWRVYTIDANKRFLRLFRPCDVDIDFAA